MPQKFYQKATVQQALITSALALITAVIVVVCQQLWAAKENGNLKSKLTDLNTDKQDLHNALQEKNSKIQELQDQLLPFQAVALQRYERNDADALNKLATSLNQMAVMLADTEQKLAETQKELDLVKNDRQLTNEQVDIITRALGETEGIVYVDGDLTNTEARAYAKIIALCLGKTSLSVKHDPGAGFIQVHNKGVVLVIKEGVSNPSHLLPLQNSLRKAGIDTQIVRATPRSWEIDESAVFIWVCRK